nr:hypothetical protein [Phenylobacterium sp.]
MEARRIDTVLVIGTLTSICRDPRPAMPCTLGLRVIMVADGAAARRDQNHNAALCNVYRSFGGVRPAQEVPDLIGVCAAVRD